MAERDVLVVGPGTAGGKAPDSPGRTLFVANTITVHMPGARAWAL